MNKSLLLILGLAVLTSYAQRINEICPSNSTVYEHPVEGFSDWIEIKNTGESEITLEGWSLCNKKTLLDPWTFPAIELEEDETFVFAAKEFSVNSETINFSFNRSGGTIYLVSPEGIIADSVSWPELHPNNSYGRIDGNWYFFDTPSPEQSNSDYTGYKGYASTPTVNRKSGVHTKGTHIVLRSEPNEHIFYSFNGTNPTSGTEYNAPIILNKNVHLKAVSTGDSLISSFPLDRTYFTELNHNLPVINITVDSLELFDENVGIYTHGPDAEEEFPYAGANFWKDLEINAHYEYFDENMRLKEALNCGLKIHGGAGSRIRPMKSFQLRAKNAYDPSYFHVPHFEEKSLKDFKRILLRNSGNDFCGTCIKDGTLHKYFLKNNLDVDLLAYKPVVVYINGAYWGIHNMREKIDRYYIGHNYDIDPNSINMLERDNLQVVSGSADSFIELKDYALEHDLAEDEHYQWVAENLDIESFIDYFIVELYSNNRDWPNNNLKLWNAPEHPQWRYICYDLDGAFRTLGTDLEDTQSLAYILDNLAETNPHVGILNALLENPEFKQNFINRYADLLNTIFEPEQIYNAFLSEKDTIREDMIDHYTKWCGPIQQWDERFNGIKGFIYLRVTDVQNELSSVFDLPKPVDMVFDTYPSGAGRIHINSIAPERFPKVFPYYPTNEITLTAETFEGSTFQYWENLTTGERFYDQSIKHNPAAGDHFVANFIRKGTLYDIQLAPNPIEFSTRLNFSLPATTEVLILVSRPDGQVVKSIDKWGTLSRGSHWVNIDFEDLPKGFYFITISTEYGIESKQVVKV